MDDRGSVGLYEQVPRVVVTLKGRGRRENPVNRKTAPFKATVFLQMTGRAVEKIRPSSSRQTDG